MTRKNWYLTENLKIVDLNRYIGFFTEQNNMGEFIVFANINNDDDIVNIGMFDKEEKAKDYLLTIYNQLWDEHYKEHGEND